MTDTRGRTVLQVILTDQLAGTEQHVAELSCALHRRGWRCLVATLHSLPEELRARYSVGGEVIELPRWPAAALAFKLSRVVAREDVDIVHGHLGHGTVAALATSRLTGRPAVSSMHFIEPRHTLRRGAGQRRRLYQLIMRQAGAIIAVSEAVRPAAAQLSHTAATPVRVIHNGIGCIEEPSPGAPRRGASRDARVILFAGRLSSEKQPALAIEAVSLMRSDCQLWVAGQGDQEADLWALARRTTFRRIRFLGYVKNVPELMRHTAVLVVPSRAEPFGLVVLEAMRAAVPVVGFRSGALPEIVEHGVTGVLVNAGDVTAMAAAMDRLVSHPDVARAMGAAGKRRFVERFTAARMAAETAHLYEEVIRAKEPSR